MIRILTGDCRDVLPTLDAGSVHCVVTSPPYFGLRDYGTATWDGGDAVCDHKRSNYDRGECADRSNVMERTTPYRDICGKCGARRIDRQLGLEATPDEYIQTMVEVFRLVRRVLRDDGTCWVNMGDSYAGGAGGRGDRDSQIGRADGTSGKPSQKHDGVRLLRPLGAAKPKDLLMMPARLALALQADGWWLRSDIIWAKPNPMPESVTDRPTSAHEHVFLLTKSARYFYDADAVREPHQDANVVNGAYTNPKAIHRDPDNVPPNQGWATNGGGGFVTRHRDYNPAGRNLRNVWTIATAPFPAAHFATFPPELAERCIRAGTSERGCCAQCGKPWMRVTEKQFVRSGPERAKINDFERDNGWEGTPRGTTNATTTGWSPGCQCNADTVPCVVLDPFSGAGTSGLVADRLGRDAVMIDLNHQYVEMARERLQADCPLFADITDAPVPSEDAYDRDMRDLFAEAAE